VLGELRTLAEEPGRSKTCIVIAHRLSTVMDADQILVLRGGALVRLERAPPASLLPASVLPCATLFPACSSRSRAPATGRIAEVGNHRELLARGGEYAQLWASQSAYQ
jgi:ABC-type transport system involved in Fe-S cluster assembly fused permease/ATPase subunit